MENNTDKDTNKSLPDIQHQKKDDEKKEQEQQDQQQ